jgi:hypothetical protein
MGAILPRVRQDRKACIVQPLDDKLGGTIRVQDLGRKVATAEQVCQHVERVEFGQQNGGAGERYKRVSGGVLNTRSAWVIGFASFVARVRAGAEVAASPRLAF